MSNPAPDTPSAALNWKLSNFRPRKPVPPQNDQALEMFLSGVVDFTRPANTEADAEDGSRW